MSAHGQQRFENRDVSLSGCCDFPPDVFRFRRLGEGGS